MKVTITLKDIFALAVSLFGLPVVLILLFLGYEVKVTVTEAPKEKRKI